jgi:ATP/maltotriose-dependent transcriptional regulator MalT
MDLVGGTLAVDADVVTLGYIVLARVQHARGDSSAALATLEQFASLARVRNFVAQLIACGSAAQVRLWLAQAQLTAAVRWVDASGLHADDRDLPFLREAEYLTFARVQIALQGGAASQALPDTLGLLDRLLLGAEANGRVHSVIEILLVRALALDAQGELTQALSALERALALAEPEGYVRTFVDEGAQMAALLVHVAARELAVAAYATKLLEAFPERLEARDLRLGDPAQASSLQPLASSLIEPLTEREREVLQLIVAGKSNAQIAQALVVAVSTVKAHVNHLFGKLAVTSRTQAIARARELHLL